MSRKDVNLEALARQGSQVRVSGRMLRIAGTTSAAVYESGSEGLVHLATDEKTGEKYRIKCFWEPDERRLNRSKRLIALQLGEMSKSLADALGGAPFDVVSKLGPHTPYAILMKNVRGTSWKNLKERGKADVKYPPSSWPPGDVRATWAYGLATAVKKMEARGFIHADLSPGNVMVTPAGADAGDMALVDFDEFFHPPYEEPTQGFRGSDGYAAPEIWQRRSVAAGADRVAMAILIQEFLVIGDPDIKKDEAFGWSYAQDTEIASQKAEAHPLLAKKYPALAATLIDTLRAANGAGRPQPDVWRKQLQTILDKSPAGPPLGHLTIDSHPVVDAKSRLNLPVHQRALDLAKTHFHIRAQIERNADRSVDLVVHPGAELNVKVPGSSAWKTHTEAQRVTVVSGLIIFDRSASLSAQLTSGDLA